MYCQRIAVSELNPWPKFLEKLQSAWIQAILELHPKLKPQLEMPKKMSSAGLPEQAQDCIWLGLSPTEWVWLNGTEAKNLLKRIRVHHKRSPAAGNRLSDALNALQDEAKTDDFAQGRAIQSIIIEASHKDTRWVLGLSRLV